MGICCQGEWATCTIPSPDVITVLALGYGQIYFLHSNSTLIPGDSSEKLKLVKDIIVTLAKHLESGAKIEEWVGLNLDRFLSGSKAALDPQAWKQRKTRYGSLFAQRDFDSK